MTPLNHTAYLYALLQVRAGVWNAILAATVTRQAQNSAPPALTGHSKMNSMRPPAILVPKELSRLLMKS